MDSIQLKGITAQSILGVYPSERDQRQTVVLDVTLLVDTRAAAASEDLHLTVDYARLGGELRFLLTSCHFLLLETAAEALCRYVLLPPMPGSQTPRITGVHMTLTKPEAMAAGTPSLTLAREATEYTYAQESKDFGWVDVIHESASRGIYRLRVAPGRTIQTHHHVRMQEHELVLGSGLLLQGAPAPTGTAFRWPRAWAHRYDNPTDKEQAILCVDRPRFMPEDEILTPTPSTGLAMVEGVSYYPKEHEVPYGSGLCSVFSKKFIATCV